MNQKMRKLLSVFLAVVFIASTGILIFQWIDKQESTAANRNAEELAFSSQETTLTEATVPETEAPVPSAEATQPPETVWIPAPVEDEDPNMEKLAQIDLSALQQVNEDVIGWIMIPDSIIKFPITQGEDNAYYLEHTWDRRENGGGAIFLECQNSPDLTDFNTIIYGHNLKDGNMFSSLRYYKSQEYWEEHPYIYIVTKDGVFRYEVFSTYEAAVDSATYGLSFNQKQTREEFIQLALENSQIETGITPEITDRIITLSTCTGVTYEYRRVVHARLKMIELEEA